MSDNPGILGFEIKLKYDKDILTPIPQSSFVDEDTGTTIYQYAYAGDAMPTASFTSKVSALNDTEYNTNSMVTISYSNTKALYNNGNFFFVDFKVTDTATIGASPIVVSYAKVIGEEINLSVSPSVENGQVFITSEDSSEVIRGDVFIDGEVDVRDNILLSQYIVKVTTLSERQLKAANVYQDSKINTKDTVRLSQLIVGWNFDETENISLFSATITPIFSVAKCKAEADGYIDVPITISNNSGITWLQDFYIH